MSDYYTLNTPAQPKSEIGDYLESCGILVPRRFASLEDAKKAGLPVIGRFEHPQDYEGASNIGPSLRINYPEKEDWRLKYCNSLQDLKIRIKQPDFSDGDFRQVRENMEYYCFRMGIKNIEGFIDQASFSFWEFIPGVNLAVVADSAIDGRFHVTMQCRAGVGLINYAVIEPDKSLRLPLASQKYLFRGNSPLCEEYIPNTEYYGHLEPRLEQIARESVEVYKNVRNLQRFDKNHAYILEMQADKEGRLYMLQVHRTRDMDIPNFTVERPTEEGWIDALEVRGKTKTKEGERFRLTYHGTWYLSGELPDEQASCYRTLYPLFDELMSRRRELEILDGGNSFCEKIVGHGGRSSFFKPRLSLVFDCYGGFLTEDERKNRENGATMDIKVIADGTRAFIRRE